MAGTKAKATVEQEVCAIKDCVVCARAVPRWELVAEANIGRAVSYYDEGWRVGTLESVRRYGTYQRDNDGHLISIGACTVVPLGTMYSKRRPDSVRVDIESVKAEAAVILTHRHELPVQPAPVNGTLGTAEELKLNFAPVFAGIDLAGKISPSEVESPTTHAGIPEDSGRSEVVMDMAKAISMRQAKANWTDIAVAMGYARGKGQNRCRRALEKAGIN